MRSNFVALGNNIIKSHDFRMDCLYVLTFPCVFLFFLGCFTLASILAISFFRWVILNACSVSAFSGDRWYLHGTGIRDQQSCPESVWGPWCCTRKFHFSVTHTNFIVQNDATLISIVFAPKFRPHGLLKYFYHVQIEFWYGVSDILFKILVYSSLFLQKDVVDRAFSNHYSEFKTKKLMQMMIPHLERLSLWNDRSAKLLKKIARGVIWTSHCKKQICLTLNFDLLVR